MMPSGVYSAGKLHANLRKINAKNKPSVLPRYLYPTNLLTVSSIAGATHRGANLFIPATHLSFVTALDSQKKKGKKIFGGGFLTSDDHALIIEQARSGSISHPEPTHVWELSNEEKDKIKSLGISAAT
jgi:hypothetical protein